jgi:hypothetical protein
MCCTVVVLRNIFRDVCTVQGCPKVRSPKISTKMFKLSLEKLSSNSNKLSSTQVKPKPKRKSASFDLKFDSRSSTFIRLFEKLKMKKIHTKLSKMFQFRSNSFHKNFSLTQV